MASDLSYYLVQYLSNSSLSLTALAFFVAYLIWELPRLTKMLEEEWIKGIYPEHGRVVDIVLLLIGLGSFIFLQANLSKAVMLAYKSGYNLLLAAGLVALPLIILLGFIGRFFTRMDAKLQVSAFMVQTILDLAHTLFFVCFVGLVFPLAALIFTSFL